MGRVKRNQAMLGNWTNALLDKLNLNKYLAHEERGGNSTGALDLKERFNELQHFNKSYKPKNQTVEEITACHSIGSLIAMGVPILEAIGSTGETLSDFGRKKPYEALGKVHQGIRQGDTMSNPMYELRHKNPIKNLFFFNFQSESCYLTDIGEETGDLDKMLHFAGHLQEGKIKNELRPDQIDQLIFYNGWATLENAGLPHLRSIRTLEGNSKHYGIGPDPLILSAVGDRIESGDSVGQAIKRFDYFPKLFAELIGEENMIDKELMMYAKTLNSCYLD